MSTRQRQRLYNNFENNKTQCLGKRDKSSAGRIDPRAVDICAVLNALPKYYTTSSCAGRCFLYRGRGCKSKTTDFERCRVSHEPIADATRYFDLSTLETDPSGGGDPVRSIGRSEHVERLHELEGLNHSETNGNRRELNGNGETLTEAAALPSEKDDDQSETKETASRVVWLRFEPFILHVACRSLSDANDLVTAARPTFKNVGLTTWKDSKYLVAIWGDEGLDMPLCLPDGNSMLSSSSSNSSSLSQWLAELVNERHERNWNKIQQFIRAARELLPCNGSDDDDQDLVENGMQPQSVTTRSNVPRSFDVVGDVALLHSLALDTEEERRTVGQAILQKNKAIKIVALRQANLVGTERAPGDEGLVILAGMDRSPLITTHCEYGIKCVVDLNHTFFSPRMGPERLRICQQVARGENVLVLFAGVGMEALQIAGRTEASSVLAVELGTVAAECAQRGHRMLQRNKTVKCMGAAERLTILQGDVLEILPTLETNHYDRVLAPRPKEGDKDGDLGSGDGGASFLDALLPVMKQDHGECHWYDFVADHEFPACDRTRRLLEKCCAAHGLSVDVLHVANAGSVAIRQIRVCVDFRISTKKDS